jgi:hypothetical protein
MQGTPGARQPPIGGCGLSATLVSLAMGLYGPPRRPTKGLLKWMTT